MYPATFVIYVCPSEIEIWKETLLKWTIISSTVNWAVFQQSHRELISSGLYMYMYVIWVHVCSKCRHESVEWCIHLTKYFFYSLKAFRVEFGYISVALQKLITHHCIFGLVACVVATLPQKKNKIGEDGCVLLMISMLLV